MTLKEQILEELSQNSAKLANLQGLLGFDGFLNTTNENPTIAGSGPIITTGLLTAGLTMKYFGALGYPEIHSAFKDFAKDTAAVSLCEPGDLKKITFEEILQKIGEGIFIDSISRADLIGFTNWALTPNLTNILSQILEKILPNYGPHQGRVFLFDLGDISKRSEGDLRSVFAIIKKFQNYGDVLMALSSNEAELIHHSLENNNIKITKNNAKSIASDLSQSLEISMIAIYDKEYSACATHRDNFLIDRSLNKNEEIDCNYFKVGLSIGYLLKLSPISVLALATTFSEAYLKNKASPTLTEVTHFISLSY